MLISIRAGKYTDLLVNRQPIFTPLERGRVRMENEATKTGIMGVSLWPEIELKFYWQ
jgi:hypothetical protein